ncbi:putative secreted protein [Nostocoides australiense Ben110]|uniref:endopeptidase La n=1 Tax=Nostocoides australiense Ben110 TaxID=1193182 RepID=W6K0L2_9MICO|nr:PDZ domain-containing protein [Tetrasphaera sp.]CCH71844.1 putative secreted protein [Tetrasphaera australiensis Ben110]
MGGPAVKVAERHTAPPWQPDPGRLSPRVARLLWAAFVGITLAAVIALIPLPYAILRPGPATNTLGQVAGKPLVAIEGATTYPTEGALDFTTVSVVGGPGRRVNAWDLLGAAIDPSAEIFDEDQLFPKGATSEEVKEENALEMTTSQHEAAAVALRSLGKSVPNSYVVASVTKGSGADGVLLAGDVITGVDGEAVASMVDIQRLVRTHKAGEDVTVSVRRDGAAKDLIVRTTASGDTVVLGVRLRMDYDFPVAVTIDAGDVGGPSAGTMFALAVRDLLTPGAMTGGKKIAGTGTIDDAGTVGPIGGIRQKIVGAKEAGAGYFLAPAANCPELAGHVPDDITVVKIATFDEAVSAVDGIAAGKTGLPSCS